MLNSIQQFIRQIWRHFVINWFRICAHQLHLKVTNYLYDTRVLCVCVIKKLQLSASVQEKPQNRILRCFVTYVYVYFHSLPSFLFTFKCQLCVVIEKKNSKKIAISIHLLLYSFYFFFPI